MSWLELRDWRRLICSNFKPIFVCERLESFRHQRMHILSCGIVRDIFFYLSQKVGCEFHWDHRLNGPVQFDSDKHKNTWTMLLFQCNEKARWNKDKWLIITRISSFYHLDIGNSNSRSFLWESPRVQPLISFKSAPQLKVLRPSQISAQRFSFSLQTYIWHRAWSGNTVCTCKPWASILHGALLRGQSTWAITRRCDTSMY